MEQLRQQSETKTTEFKPREFYNTHLEKSLSKIDPDLAKLILEAQRKRMKIGTDGNPEMQMMYEESKKDSHQTALTESHRLKAFWVDYLANDYTGDFNLNIQFRGCCWIEGGRPCPGCEKKFELGLVPETL